MTRYSHLTQSFHTTPGASSDISIPVARAKRLADFPGPVRAALDAVSRRGYAGRAPWHGPALLRRYLTKLGAPDSVINGAAAELARSVGALEGGRA